jgi:hypothetical protein
MTLPGFTAEASLYGIGNKYRSGTAHVDRRAAVVPTIVLGIWHVCEPCTDGWARCFNYFPGPNGQITVGNWFLTRCQVSPISRR